MVEFLMIGFYDPESESLLSPEPIERLSHARRKRTEIDAIMQSRASGPAAARLIRGKHRHFDQVVSVLRLNDAVKSIDYTELIEDFKDTYQEGVGKDSEIIIKTIDIRQFTLAQVIEINVELTIVFDDKSGILDTKLYIYPDDERFDALKAMLSGESDLLSFNSLPLNHVRHIYEVDVEASYYLTTLFCKER